MSDHDLERQPEERIFAEIADLKRQVMELRTVQQQGTDALNIKRSGSLTLSVALGAGAGGYLGASVVNYAGTAVFATIEFDFYEDVVDAAHLIGSGVNNFQDHWTLRVWPKEASSTDTSIIYVAYMFNNDASGHTIYWKLRSRYLANPSP